MLQLSKQQIYRHPAKKSRQERICADIENISQIDKPHNREELHTWIKTNLNLDIPQRNICQGHNAPFDFVAESYFEEVLYCIVIANRNGGKTINSAALEFAESTNKEKCESAHLGAIMAQADRAYQYVRAWSYDDLTRIDRTIQKETRFKNGSRIEVIPGTMSAVNGPHPHKAAIDEFELMEWEVFEEAGSMPKSRDDISAALRLLTTRKKATGNAQKMIIEADSRGFKLYKWCIFEVMTPCDYSGSCKTCPYKKHISYDNDGNELTWTQVCNGKAKRCRGYYQFQDVLKMFLTLSWEVFNAQWLCNKPERYDCVFSEFSEDRNVLEKWELQHGEDWQFGRGWDFGLDDPTAVAFFQHNEKTGQLVQFDEFVTSGMLIDDIGEEIRSRSDKYAPPEKWLDWGDPSGNNVSGIDGYSYIGKLSEFEIYVNTQWQKVSDGIQAMKKKLRRSSMTGKPSYHITRNCTKTQEALEMAQWERSEGKQNKYSKEKYRHDEHSHILDASRYYVVGVFPMVENTVGFG